VQIKEWAIVPTDFKPYLYAAKTLLVESNPPNTAYLLANNPPAGP